MCILDDERTDQKSSAYHIETQLTLARSLVLNVKLFVELFEDKFYFTDLLVKNVKCFTKIPCV